MDTNWKDHALTVNNNVYLGFIGCCKKQAIVLK